VVLLGQLCKMLLLSHQHAPTTLAHAATLHMEISVAKITVMVVSKSSDRSPAPVCVKQVHLKAAVKAGQILHSSRCVQCKRKAAQCEIVLLSLPVISCQKSTTPLGIIRSH